MSNVIFSMSVSLDGYVAGPDGDFSWSAPDDELHRFHNDRVRELGAHVLGRRLYETMVYWETADRDPSSTETTRDFAAIWQALPKVVVSTTLERVEGNTRLIRGDVADEVRALKEQTDADIGVGGAGLAASLTEAGLIDEYQVFVNPVAVGGGTPFFPAGQRVDLQLLDARTLSSQVVYLRYRRV
jgi:dihydrofolate reductase